MIAHEIDVEARSKRGNLLHAAKNQLDDEGSDVEDEISDDDSDDDDDDDDDEEDEEEESDEGEEDEEEEEEDDDDDEEEEEEDDEEEEASNGPKGIDQGGFSDSEGEDTPPVKSSKTKQISASATTGKSKSVSDDKKTKPQKRA